MLRRVSVAHLAFQHSPEKEQRFIQYTTGTRRRIEGPTGPESQRRGPRGISDMVNRITGRTRSRMREVAPELLIRDVPHLDELFDLLDENGIQETALAELTAKFGGRELTTEEKGEVMERFLKDPQRVLSVARALEREQSRDEETMGIIEQKCKILGKNDPAEIEAIVQRAEQEPTPEAYERRILSELGDRKAIRYELARIRQNYFPDEYLRSPPTAEELDRDAVKYVEEIVTKSGRKWKLFGRRPATTDEEARARRDQYRVTLKRQSETVQRVLDAELQTRLLAEYARLQKMPGVARAKGKPWGVMEEEVLEMYLKRLREFIRSQYEKKAPSLPLPGSPEYMTCAEEVLLTLERTKSLEPDLDAARKDAEAIDEFARSFAEKLQKLDTTQLAQLDNSEMKDLTRMREMYLPYLKGKISQRHRWKVRSMGMKTLEADAQQIASLEAMPSLAARMRESIEGAGSMENTENTCKTLRERLESVMQELPKYLHHTVCTTLGLLDRLRQRQFDVRNLIAVADKHRIEERGTRAFQSAAIEVSELEKALALLRSLWTDPELVRRIPSSDEYKTATKRGYDSNGHYDSATGTIVINSEKLAKTHTEEEDVLMHERGHAILDILTRRTGVFPGLLIASHRALTETARAQGISMEDLEQRLKDAWMIPKEAPEGDMGRDVFMHELLSHYSDWRMGLKPKATADERSLFSLLLGENAKEDTPEETGGGFDFQFHQPGDLGIDDIEAGGEAEEGPRPQTAEEKETIDPAQELKNIEWIIGRIEAFLKAYPQYKNDPTITEWFPQLQREYAICKEEFAAGRHTAPGFNEKLQLTKKLAEDFDNAMRKIDLERMDLTHVPRSTAASLWRRFTRNVEWMSISDIISMFRDIKEDIQRMWNRRSQAARSRMGERITGLIPEVIPYFGWLKHDFRGREKASEQEEVGIWEKRYEKIDEEQLLRMVGETTNRDQVKAIVNLLTNRGRMDFDHEPFWTTLERLSRYSMPHGPCRRDNLLRNTYLQKLITDIWGEKSLFEHWKTTNDGGIKKGKDSFQATTDDLSNIRKGLKGMLHRLLQNRIKEQSGGELSKEEEVNPHLYEQVLNYAMRNGKMTMEEKFFYLIQGIAHGIMNVDRLHGFTGEQGGVLMQFPFIDYFTDKNNTLPEIRKIASRIGTPDQVEPDYRTTYFLYQEVMQNKSAQDRMSKALKVAQNIDHEDIPMLLSVLDYNNVKNLISVFSGNLWKVSPPAMKNGYVGYNSVFQYYAARARMYLEGVPGAKPLTQADLTKLATTIAASVHYDNLVTGTAMEPKIPSRPSLSWNEINNTVPVSGGTTPTGAFRDKMNAFSFNLAESLGIETVNTLSLNEVIGKDRHDVDSVARLGKETRERLGENETPEELGTTIARRLGANPIEAMRLLAQFAEGQFIPEGSDAKTGKGFLYNNIKQIAKDWD